MEEIDRNEKKKSLFSIVADANNIVNHILDCGGEIDDELMKQFEVNEKDLSSKVDNYYAVIDRLSLEEKFLKEKSDEFLKASKTMQNTHVRMKNMIKSSMVALGKSEIVGENWKFKISKLKDKMIIHESKIVMKYYSEKTKMVIDKKKIEEDLGLGQTVTGVTFEENYSLNKYVAKKGK